MVPAVKGDKAEGAEWQRVRDAGPLHVELSLPGP
jgi:hypothetical protein